MTNYSKRCKQCGLAAVEFILLTPLIILFLAVFIEIGSIFIEYNTLNKLVRNGARHAVNNIYGTASSNQIAAVDEIKNIVVYGSVSVGDASILRNLTFEDVTVTHENDLVTVTANYDYVPLVYTVLPFTNVSVDIDIAASSVMETGK